MTNRSPIFELLNKHDDRFDVDGLVAYALYKKHKRSWAKEFFDEHGKEPTSKQKLDFAKSVSTKDQLIRYRMDAQDALIEYAESLIDEARPSIREDAMAGRIEDAADRIEAQASFKSMVLNGAVSTLISTFVLLLLALVLWLFGIDLLDALETLNSSG